MLHRVREKGDVSAAATSLLALLGIASPTVEQTVGAHVLGYIAADLCLIAKAHSKKD